ncbi:MAG: histidine kinase [Rubrivivax sp.]|nr:histidine kinase [Rubrivivax sp.]
MPKPSTLPSTRSLRLDLAVVLLFWAFVTLGLALSSYLDARRAGSAISLARALATLAPLMLPQVSFSLVVAWLLHRRRHWLDRPLRLLAASAAVIPLYLLLATPAVVALGMWTRGQPASGFTQALSDWTAVNVWVDGMTACAGLALQIGWAFWRHAQVQREAALRASAENLSLRLTLLQGQLEPHFLFNTLNGIAALVRGAERAVALQALNRLSELLRYALRASQQRWVSVADELRFVDDYVALQRLRFGEALRWQADVEPADWVRWACPPLLLQPLVENAIRHGLESGIAGPLLLRVHKSEGRLQLALDNPRSDGGPLMPGHGVGLAKTVERLQALYGDRAQLCTTVGPTLFELRLSLPLEDLDAALEAADR